MPTTARIIAPVDGAVVIGVRAMKYVIPGGTGQVGALCAKRWRAAGHEVVCVYSQPPRPAGRGARK